MFYYPHHIGDFTRDTARLSDSQCMAYLRLIWNYYDTEKPLSGSVEKLAFLVGSNVADISLILEHYFTFDGESYHHSRCDKVLTEYAGKSEKARKSANARWNNANAIRTHSERNADALKNDANREPITNNQKNTVERTTRGARLSIHFEPDFDFAKQNGVSNPTEEFAKFRDYWNSQAGQKAVKTDWQATWRNWCRNSRKDVQKANYEPPYAKYMREKVEKMSPSIAAPNPNNPSQPKRIDPNEFLRTIEAQNVIRIN